MTYYLPIFRRQIGDPTTTRDGFICTMTAGAMALDYHTRGQIQVWGGDLEKHQNDHVGGTDLNDLKIAWAYYGQVMTPGTGGWAGVTSALAQGKAVVLAGDYDQLTNYSCQLGFDDDHAIVLIPSTDNQYGFVVGDPLCRNFKTIPASVIKAYAEKFSASVYFATSKAQPAILPNSLVLHINANAKTMIAKFGVDGCISGWTTKVWGPTASTASCQEPVYRKGCISGSASIAFVNNGTFKNQWIRIGNGVWVSP